MLTFNEEQYLPAREALALNMKDAECKQTRECTTQRSRGVVYCHPLAHLISLVESGQIDSSTRSYCVWLVMS